MSVQAECDAVAAEFDDQLENLKQLEERIAATDERLAMIRESIRGLGCRSVAQALETPAPDDSIAPRPSAPAKARALGLLPWVLVVIGTLPILFISVNTLKPAASNTRLPVARSTTSAPVTSGPVASGPMTSGPMTSGPMTSGPMTSEPVTTAIALRDNQPATPDGPDTSNGPRQPEPSTVAPAQEEPPQEPTMVMRPTLPPGEDDPSPAAPAVAPSPPATATPGSVDAAATASTPL